MPHLEDWAFVIHPDTSPYQAPETYTTHVAGKWIDGHHPRLGDPTGLGIVTSVLKSYDHDAKIAITRSGTVYSLGEPNPTFLKILEGSGKSLRDYHKHIDRDSDHGPPTSIRRI